MFWQYIFWLCDEDLEETAFHAYKMGKYAIPLRLTFDMMDWECWYGSITDA